MGEDIDSPLIEIKISISLSVKNLIELPEVQAYEFTQSFPTFQDDEQIPDGVILPVEVMSKSGSFTGGLKLDRVPSDEVLQALLYVVEGVGTPNAGDVICRTITITTSLNRGKACPLTKVEFRANLGLITEVY